MTDFKDWKEYINQTLIGSELFEEPITDLKADTESKVYKTLDKNSQTEIRVGFLKNNRLIYLQIFNPLIPGYNKLVEGEYFEKYDFHETKNFGDSGLEFTEKNKKEISDILDSGLEGEEIQYVLNQKILKSSVWLMDTEFHSNYDFTGRGFWKKLFGKKIEQMDGIEKRKIDLNEIFSGIKNVL